MPAISKVPRWWTPTATAPTVVRVRGRGNDCRVTVTGVGAPSTAVVKWGIKSFYFDGNSVQAVRSLKRSPDPNIKVDLPVTVKRFRYCTRTSVHRMVPISTSVAGAISYRGRAVHADRFVCIQHKANRSHRGRTVFMLGGRAGLFMRHRRAAQVLEIYYNNSTKSLQIPIPTVDFFASGGCAVLQRPNWPTTSGCTS